MIRLILVSMVATFWHVTAQAAHIDGIENLTRSLISNNGSSNKWTRVDRFQNVGLDPLTLPAVEFLFLNPEDVGFSDVTNNNAFSVQAAAIQAFPEFDFIGVSWWVDGDSPERAYSDSGSVMPLDIVLQPGDTFDLTSLAAFFGPGCGPCNASNHSELVIGWHFVNQVPIPAAAWLFGSALLGLGVVKRKKNRKLQ